MDNAIADMSRISHNISPHILEKHGLITALENFLSEIKISDNIKFVINFEKFSRFDLKKELTIYRTISELINNTIKHANATLITIDIFTPKFRKPKAIASILRTLAHEVAHHQKPPYRSRFNGRIINRCHYPVFYRQVTRNIKKLRKDKVLSQYFV